MASTVVLEYTKRKSLRNTTLATMGKAQRFTKGLSSGFIPDYRHAVETVGESDGFVNSGHIDSEDSSAPKRKCISLNTEGSDCFNVPVQTFSVSLMSSLEKKQLEHRLREELEQIQLLQKKVLSRAVNGVAVSSTTDASGKKRPAVGRTAPQIKRGHSGRFEPVKSVPQLSLPKSINAALIKQCEQLLNRLLQHPYAWVFKQPVDAVKLNIPDYYTVIKHPMDLGTIKTKLTSGTYASPLGFASDVRLTFSNAKTYNPPGNDVHIMAEAMSNLFESKWKSIEKKVPTVDSHAARESEAVKPPDMKKRKAPSVNQASTIQAGAKSLKNEVKNLKERVTGEEKQKLSSRLESLIPVLPDQIIEFLKKNSGNQSQTTDDEIEIDIDALDDTTFLELRKLLDDFCSGRELKHEMKADLGEIEVRT